MNNDTDPPPEPKNSSSTGKYVLLIDNGLRTSSGDWREKHILKHERFSEDGKMIEVTREFMFADREVHWTNHWTGQQLKYPFDHIDLNTIPDRYKPMFAQDPAQSGSPQYGEFYYTQADVERKILDAAPEVAQPPAPKTVRLVKPIRFLKR